MENVFSADYAFAQDVMDEVETIVDRVGPLSFVKNILLFYLEDHGIHDGVVWECAVNLPSQPTSPLVTENTWMRCLPSTGKTAIPRLGNAGRIRRICRPA